MPVEEVAPLCPGQIARVRQRRYLIEEVIPPTRGGDSTLVRLSCLDDDNQGRRLEVLWDREIDAEVLTGEDWKVIAKRGFDDAKIFAAYLNTLRWNCVTATDPRLFQSPFRAGIKLDAYQLEPLRKALRLPRVNLFIADDVGLGKTIEAGLIARELLLRKKVRDIVVSCPPSTLIQWQEELEARFGLTFEILDRDYMRRVRRERGFAVNPWNTHSRFLFSHSLLIDEAYTGPMLDWLGDFREGSLFILDEAHHAAPSSGQKYAIDSQITRAVRELAPRFEHRLFLSATPHNGHSNSFSALLEILDPQRFCRGVPVTAKHRDEVIVRRLKEDIREIQGGFPKRNVVQLDITGLREDAPELVLSRLLDEYRELREERLKNETRRTQAASGLLIVGLQQRLLSSIEAFARTLRVHRKTVERQWREGLAKELEERAGKLNFDMVSGSIGNDDERATLPEEDLEQELDAQVENASAVGIGSLIEEKAQRLFNGEKELLDRMSEIAEDARSRPDARVRKLVDWIRANMCADLGKPSAFWNDLRIIIFTEYEDTLRYLRQQLESAIQTSDRAESRIEVYRGPTPPAEREEIKQAFNADPKKHPVRILLATDAAREGLNLQTHCWNLFHFDVPWNPARMEQRNGRIDRKLQPHVEVFCHYFVYQQRPEDRILQTVVRKTELIKEQLGSLSQVIEARLAKTLAAGIRRAGIEALRAQIESADLDNQRRKTVTDELEAVRDRQNALREQVEQLRHLLEESKKTIGLEEEQFRDTVSSALGLMGSPPLTQLKHLNNGGPARFIFPALDEREGGDATWADSMDSLRVPRKRGEKPWEWRRTSPVRPVVFEDVGTMDDSVVHLHLEQRVVQRLLGHFLAQGFLYHDLSRACFAQTTDAVRRVILLGRLSLYGLGAARLHEELIPITARWVEPQIRKEPLTPYARDAETRTLALLEKALLQRRQQIAEPVLSLLQTSAPQDVRELLPQLELRGEEYMRDAEEKLTDRGNSEARAMREILQTQRKHIQTTAQRHDAMDADQLRLEFGDDAEERRQLELNKRYWAKRLESLSKELETEPSRIRELYQVKARRIEPVGIVYLWPVTG
jgi:superfamily II DNA or RNA helicase